MPCTHHALRAASICAALVLLSALPGCATMSESDCLTADWAVIGEVDGQQGRPLSELNRYRRQCSEYGVVPDSQVYMAAREQGLALFCTTNNGYREGRSGNRNENVCPVANAGDFQTGHDLGRAVFASLNRLRSSSSTISASRNEIDDLNSTIEEEEESLRSDDLSDEEQDRKRDEIASMERRIDELENQIVILTATLGVAIADYRSAVQAARSQGFDEPMESELINELGRLTR